MYAAAVLALYERMSSVWHADGAFTWTLPYVLPGKVMSMVLSTLVLLN